MDQSPVFAAHAVSKRYRRGGPWALREVTLALPAGSITALVGPNGAGKSSLIRTAVGFERPTDGWVEVAGIDPWKRRADALARVGYVPQSLALYHGLSVIDHVRLGHALRRRFDMSLALGRLVAVGVDPGRRVGDLSGGEQAQVALALAIGTRAPLLLLDEPLANLDPLARREFLRALVDGARLDGSAVLLSSHITTDVAGLVDRIVVLGAGTKLLDDSVAEVLASHRVLMPDEVNGAVTVARFPTSRGETRMLVRSVDSAAGMPATLDDVVMGYLALGRDAVARSARAA